MKLKKVEVLLKKNINRTITCSEFHGSIVLNGIVSDWNEVIKAGYLAAKKGYKNVVNKLIVENIKIPDISKPFIKDNSLHNTSYDVVIIGGGIIGTAIARELSKNNLSIILLEKESDLAMHTSSRNDGMVHPAFTPKPGTKKADYNYRGNRLYPKIAKELNIEFTQKGSLVLFDNKFLKIGYPLIKARTNKNKEEIIYLSKKEVYEKEPYLRDGIEFGLFLPHGGIISPYKTTIAFGENAVQNGAKISLNTIVESFEKNGDKITGIVTNRGTIRGSVVINAAGNFSDQIAEMAGDGFFSIHPRKGEIVIIDKKKGHLLNSIVSRPDLELHSKTKGGGLIKTVEGNLLVGPNAYEQPFKEDYSTTPEGISAVMNKHFKTIKGLSPSDIITYFSGIRAATYEEDFIIEKSDYIKNLIHVAGIQSPGVASAPAIALDVEEMTKSIISKSKVIKPNPNWNPVREPQPFLNTMSYKERNGLIKKNPDYGKIICRCEEISKGEIIDALHSSIPINNIDSLKRRIRTGMGRCQGGFCSPLIMKIINEELGIDYTEITKFGGNSFILSEETKKYDNTIGC